MTDTQIFDLISKDLAISSRQISVVSKFLDEGATIPFLARYRREATGDLDEEKLRQVRDALEYRRTLEDRRESILKTITDQDKLTPELKKAIDDAGDFKTLEDLYLPYKPKRKTRATVARDKGLEPLAALMWEQETKKGDPKEYATPYVDPEKGVNNVDEALQGAMDIIAEWVNENIDVRERLRSDIRKYGVLESRKSSTVKERTVFESYYEFRCPVKYIKPHQTLALNRGEREGVLLVDLLIDEEKTLGNIDEYVLKDDDSIFLDYIYDAIEDAWKRLLKPSLERELRAELTEKADEHAIVTFARNLRNLLMQPPLSSKTVLGIDPAFRTGCKVALVDPYGKYLEGTTIYPVPPHNQVEASEAVLEQLVEKYKVDLIAIGNGTASRETEQFVADFLRKYGEKHPDHKISYLIVNEAGASVYSASDLARREFPELDAAQRGNISIARRVQDPLAELVKIDPKSIGVGLYQHDVNQIRLMQSLNDVVESCVNTVGINLNSASSALLNHVSGLTQSVADNIVKWREEKGPFVSRHQLMDVQGMGPFRFEQAAGFLRITEAENPLDNTAIHPESYDVTQKLCKRLDIDLDKLGETAPALPLKFRDLDKQKTVEELGIGLPTLELIIENLSKPGRDPRESLPQPLLRQDILKIDDLAPGQILEGTVRNVVDFGAFVDIGVKEDGLLHISKMGREGHRVENPHEVVAVGDIIQVQIESIDKERGRIGFALV
ncbi:MAG TPA: Tex family protein [Balneolales bacterium]|nr:Tex family protein [Balneolales bacterium]